MSPLDRAAWRLADDLAVAWRFGGALAIWCRNVSAAHVAAAVEVLAPGGQARGGAGDVARWVTDPALVPDGRAALVAVGVWS